MVRRELRSLTGIRGVAALVVVLYHLGEAMDLRGAPSALAFLRQGYAAVDLFFVLSGFVISYNYRDRFANRLTRRDYAGFVAKRVARLYPLYLVLTLVYFAKNTFRDYALVPDFGDWIANLTLTHSWGFDAIRILGVSWSISTELFVYLLFPPLALVLARRRETAFALAALAVGALIAVGFSGRGVKGALDVVEQGSFLPLLRCFGGFSLGLLVHHFARNREAGPLPGADPGLVLALLATVLLLPAGYDLGVALVVFPLLVLILATGSRLGDRLFANGLVHRLGEWSYAIYLVHFLFINAALALADRLAIGFGLPVAVSAPLLVMVPVLAASAILHRAVEEPGRRLVLAILQSRRPVTEPDATTPSGRG